MKQQEDGKLCNELLYNVYSSRNFKAIKSRRVRWVCVCVGGGRM